MKSWCAHSPVSVDPEAFAIEWQDAWNTHDLPRILSHYTDDVIFRSCKAKAVVGAGEVHGKDALRDYWSTALKRQPDLKFEVQDVFMGH